MSTQQLSIYFSEDYTNLRYTSNVLGKIALHKISEGLKVLKVYFSDLQLVNIPEDLFNGVDTVAEVMLTNYVVKYETLDDLDGATLIIENGWTSHETFTMLNILDGEPIQNNKITFKKIEDDVFEISWNGIWGENDNKQNCLDLCLQARISEQIITPLCMFDRELIEMYSEDVVHNSKLIPKKNWFQKLISL